MSVYLVRDGFSSVEAFGTPEGVVANLEGRAPLDDLWLIKADTGDRLASRDLLGFLSSAPLGDVLSASKLGLRGDIVVSLVEIK